MLVLSKVRDVQGYLLFQLFFPFTQVKQHVKGVPAIYISSVEFHDLKPSGGKASGLVMFYYLVSNTTNFSFMILLDVIGRSMSVSRDVAISTLLSPSSSAVMFGFVI